MTTPPFEALDSVAERIIELRAATIQALAANDTDHARQLQNRLRSTESAWHALLDNGPAPPHGHAKLPARTASGFAISTREQVHRALALMEFPTTPQRIAKTHDALFPGHLDLSKATSLRRDEERSWRATNGARPYYITPALSADQLTPVRALLTISSWPLERRVVGPHSARADFLLTAERIAHAAAEISDAHVNRNHPAAQLLGDIARALGVTFPEQGLPSGAIIAAAQREYQEIGPQDLEDRRRGAAALAELSDAEQLFGLGS